MEFDGPRDTVPRNTLSVLLGQLREYERALQEALDSNRLDPSNPFPYANVFGLYISLNRPAEARAMSERGLEVCPAYGELHRCLQAVAY